MKPFQIELKSALTGPRLMRAILEIIASGVIESRDDILMFLKQTLVYALASDLDCQHQ